MPRELANEPRNPGDYTGEVLREWIAEMSHFVKSEAPNQLVTSGSEGLWAIGHAKVAKLQNHWCAAVSR